MKEKIRRVVGWAWKFWGRPEDAGQRKIDGKGRGPESLQRALSFEGERGGGQEGERKLCQSEKWRISESPLAMADRGGPGEVIRLKV